MVTTINRTIAQSESVSSFFAVQAAVGVGLFASIPTSCVAYLQVSPDVTSANFMRAGKLDGTGDWTWNIGSGRKAVDLKDVALAFPFMRLETGVIQANVASLSIVVKF